MSWLAFGAVISMGVVTPFPIFERRLRGIKSWTCIFEASLAAFFYILVAERANQAGLTTVLSGMPFASYPSAVFLLVLFGEAALIASVVYGGFFLFRRYSENSKSP
jgi:hypothetical protein